jgi:hypothetical protein
MIQQIRTEEAQRGLSSAEAKAILKRFAMFSNGSDQFSS